MLSNERKVEKGLMMTMKKGSKKLGLLGFNFKVGTDELRESPLAEVIERLSGKGYDVKLYNHKYEHCELGGHQPQQYPQARPAYLQADGVSYARAV